MMSPPRCLGLAFVRSSTLHIVLRNDYDVEVFTGDSKTWKAWLQKRRKKQGLTLVEDPKLFRQAVRHCGTEHLLVLADYGWLTRRGVVCLDAEDRGDGIVMLTFNPEGLQRALQGAEAYEPSVVDKWLDKGDVNKRCAGCKELLTKSRCKDTTGPAAKACNQWAAEKGAKAYRAYNLCHLLHLALRNVDDALLHEMTQPKEIWIATYRYAVGRMIKKEWMARYGRILRTAGTSKERLKAINMWVNRYGHVLATGKRGNPPGKLDCTLAGKLKKG